MIVSTLCYIEKDNEYLMLLRNKKSKDVNEGKWIGVGGKLEPGESPEECVVREVEEETGYRLLDFCLKGILTFSSKGWEDEIIFVYTSDKFSGEMKDCDEGELRWIDKSKILGLNLWEGDRIFLKYMLKEHGEVSDKIFSIKLSYEGDKLIDYHIKLH